MGETAVAAAKAIGYVGAGTVEFIAEQDGRFYFMEMNTRLQVEHPVTEMITGLDLVEWQLRVAAGEPLPRAQDALAINGHAIEARIYAEDPARGFLPSTGHVSHWRMPDEDLRLRVDTGFRAGDDVTPYYDPMLAKVIAWGEDRERARLALLRALAQGEIVGVTTNLSFLERVVMHPAFARAQLDTGLIDANREELLAADAPASGRALQAAALAEYATLRDAANAAAAASSDPHSPWQLADAWWNGSAAHGLEFVFEDGDTECRVTLRPAVDGSVSMQGEGTAPDLRFEMRAGRLHIRAGHDQYEATVVAEGDLRHVFVPGARSRLVRIDPLARTGEVEETGGHLTAPMSGTVVAVLVKAGDRVDKGAPLVVLEAMKMEHTIVAPAAGRVAVINFVVGERVGEGADLVDLEGDA